MIKNKFCFFLKASNMDINSNKAISAPLNISMRHEGFVRSEKT